MGVSKLLLRALCGEETETQQLKGGLKESVSIWQGSAGETASHRLLWDLSIVLQAQAPVALPMATSVPPVLFECLASAYCPPSPGLELIFLLGVPSWRG